MREHAPQILDRSIDRDATAPAEARAAVRALRDKIDENLVPDIQLLVSELITNSVKYGGEGDVRLNVVAPSPRHVRVEVIDQGGGFIPVRRDRPADEAGGWGLHLVQALSTRWGVYEGSTHVWFEMNRDSRD